MDSIKSSGYILFVVRGALPLPNKQSNIDNLRESQMYVNIHDINKFHQENKNKKLNMTGADERELEEALKRSLQDYKAQN